MNLRSKTPRLFAGLLVLVFAVLAYCVAVRLNVNHDRLSSHDEAVAVQNTDKVRHHDGTVHVNQLPTMPLSTRQKARIAEAERELDPSKTGWQTESFNDAASKQLTLLAQVIESGSQSAGHPRNLFSKTFRCTPLRPSKLKDVFHDAVVVVRRYAAAPGSQKPTRSFKSFQKAMMGLPATTNPGDCHVKFKVTGVEFVEVSTQASNQAATTVVYAEGYGRTQLGCPAQWTATWNCAWEGVDANPDAKPPELTAIDLVAYEEIESRIPAPWLRDDTRHVFATDVGFRRQLSLGMDHWLTQLSGRLHVSRLGHNGIAIGDVNGDELPDVFVCQSGGLPNRLYVQQPTGNVRDISAVAHVDYLDDTTCALIVDIDNDGDQDLAMATVSGGLVLSNNGEGRFQPATYLPQCRNAFSLTAADYDQDGLLDLYVGRYWPSADNRGEIPIPVPYYDGQNGGKNVLLRNLGGCRFKDVTRAVGLDEDNTRYTMAAAWEDIDNDGDVDLYVANDFGKNCLYENIDGKFQNIALQAGVEDIASGMSVTFSDVNHDGLSDIYVSNMFSSAGNRITYQRKYEERFDRDGVENLRRMARGNSLFLGVGDGSFRDISVSSATTMGRWSWGSLFADINNDGREDLLVTNGNITAKKPGDL